MSDFLLSAEPILEISPAFADGQGAEARFLGVVRGMEDGREIEGIEYSAYLPMAEKILADLLGQGRGKIAHEVLVQHRLGFVAAREPSLLIRVRSRHSAEAFELCHWYLREIKTRVPIWKTLVWVEAKG